MPSLPPQHNRTGATLPELGINGQTTAKTPVLACIATAEVHVWKTPAGVMTGQTVETSDPSPIACYVALTAASMPMQTHTTAQHLSARASTDNATGVSHFTSANMLGSTYHKPITSGL